MRCPVCDGIHGIEGTGFLREGWLGPDDPGVIGRPCGGTALVRRYLEAVQAAQAGQVR